MFQQIQNKIIAQAKIEEASLEWKKKYNQIVFTNGCFDIIHYGHIHYLIAARSLGDFLVIGLNSSASVSRLKGTHRPINDDLTRTYLLAGMAFVDAVVIFDEDTPLNLIKAIYPNILVKGGDWKPDQIVGSEFVLSNGGEVRSLPFQAGYSTTNIESKIWNSRPEK